MILKQLVVVMMHMSRVPLVNQGVSVRPIQYLVQPKNIHRLPEPFTSEGETNEHGISRRPKPARILQRHCDVPTHHTCSGGRLYAHCRERANAFVADGSIQGGL